MGRKKIVQLIIVLGILLGLILIQIYSDLLWGNKSDRDGKKEVIRIWTIHGDTEKALDIALEQYRKNHPEVAFEVTVYKNEVYQTAVNNAMLTDSLPDLFFMWGYSKLQRFVDAGMIQEITDTVREDKISEVLRSKGLDAFTFEGRIYALPLYGWEADMFCNREIFQEYGMEYPSTYEQFLKVVEECKRQDIIPVVTGAKEGWLSSLYYMSLVQEEGPGNAIYRAVKDQSLFSSGQFQRAAKKMEQLIEKKIWQGNYLECDSYNAVYQFAQGKAAMLYYGSWGSTFLEGDKSKVKGKVDVIPFPNGNKKEGIGGYVDTFVINKYGAIPQRVELIQMYMEIMQSISNVVVNDMGAGLPVYKNQTVEEEKYPILYQSWNSGRGKVLYPAYDQIMSEEQSGEYYDLLNRLVFGEKSYKEFIQGLAE